MSTRAIVQAGLIAALYAALTLALAPISYGPLQVRVSEALAVLPILTPAAIPGLVIGTIVANGLGPLGLLDVIFGSLATLLGALGAHRFRARPALALACPVAANALIVPAYLPLVVGPGSYPWPVGGPVALYLSGVVTVGVGEAIAVYALGRLLLAALRRVGPRLFAEP